jgi:hypothetical protein
MFILILGVALWWAAHLLKRMAPGLRARIGRGGVAGAVAVSVVLMIVGYRMAMAPIGGGRRRRSRASTTCWCCWPSISMPPMA